MERTKHRLTKFYCCTALAFLIFITACGSPAADAVGTATVGNGAAPVDRRHEITSWDDPDISWRQMADVPVTIEMYIDFEWYQLDTWGNCHVSQEITRRTGVSLDVTKASDTALLGVLYAAGNLPEMIFTSFQVERFFDSDHVWPWNELITNYAPEFINLVDPVEIINNTQPSGNFYTLRTHYSSAEDWADPRNIPGPGARVLAWRQDIQEELGIPEITSIEGLMEAFHIVQRERPDMIVFAPSPDLGEVLMRFMGASEGIAPVIHNGVVQLGFEGPRAFEWLELMNYMTRQGFLNTEFFIYARAQWQEILRSGNVFATAHSSSVADDTNRFFAEVGMDDYWFTLAPQPLTWRGEILYEWVEAGIGWASLFISRNARNPDRAIQFAQFLKSPEGDALTQWGIYGEHYTLDEDGLLIRPPNFFDLTVQDHGIGKWYFQASGLGEGVMVTSRLVGPYPQFAQNVRVLQAYKPFHIRDPARAFIHPLPDTDEFNIRNRLNELWNAARLEIYDASSPEELRELYDAFVANAEALGASRFREFTQQAYDEARARYAGILP